MDIVKPKIAQAIKLLDELNLDGWALFERETPVLRDPTHAMVVGIDVTWTSLFLFTRAGDAIALVGNFDVDEFERTGRFTRVRSYVQGPAVMIREILEKANPKTLAMNYSVNDTASDGLTHGMFMLFQSYLEGTDFNKRIVSSEQLVMKLRSRKLSEEIARIEKAAHLATDVWSRVVPQISAGMSEKQIGALIDADIRKAGGAPSFETIVNAGSKTSAGHGHPTDAIIEQGELLHVDFGVKYNDYCSDIQRLIYFKRPGESQPPSDLTKAFDTVKQIIDKTALANRPGVKGHEVDALARKMLVDASYPEYQHALGHQLGRDVHDGGGLLGPQWERYGSTPLMPIELGNVFTLELEIMLPGIGCVGLEEDVVVESTGTRFLCERQTALVIK